VKMDCREAREQLTRSAGESQGAALREHVGACPECGRYRERSEAARDWFRQHQAEVEPNAGFAARVAARIDERPVDVLGWAAVRLLPATLVLVVVLGWLASGRSPDFASIDAGDSGDDLLTWVLDGSEVER